MMAASDEPDLNDFFAKKDKKKGKKDKKKVVGGTAAKKTDPIPLDSPEVVEERPKKPKGRIAEYNDDSWNDEMPEEKKEVDYSGLQIGILKREEEEVAPLTPEPEAEAEAEEAEPEEEAQPTEADVVEALVSASGVYRPPAARGSGGGAGPSQDWKYAKSKKTYQAPPDMSEMAFPSLSAAVEEPKTSKHDEFTRVGPGGRADTGPTGVTAEGRYVPPSARGGNPGAYQPPARRAGW